MAVAVAMPVPVPVMAMIRRVVVRGVGVCAVMMAVTGHAIPPFDSSAYHWFRRRC